MTNINSRVVSRYIIKKLLLLVLKIYLFYCKLEFKKYHSIDKVHASNKTRLQT